MVSCYSANQQDVDFATLKKKCKSRPSKADPSPKGPSEVSPRLLDPNPTWTWRLRTWSGPISTISTSPSKPPTTACKQQLTRPLRGTKVAWPNHKRCDRKTARSNGLPANNLPFFHVVVGTTRWRSCSTRSKDGKMGRDQDIWTCRLLAQS